MLEIDRERIGNNRRRTDTPPSAAAVLPPSHHFVLLNCCCTLLPSTSSLSTRLLCHSSCTPFASACRPASLRFACSAAVIVASQLTLACCTSACLVCHFQLAVMSSSASSSAGSDPSSDPSLSHTSSDAANEALIASLLSPKQSTEHAPVTSAATDAILAAADKPAHQKADSFYSTGLPDLAPQALSPVNGSPTDASSGQFSFNSGKK